MYMVNIFAASLVLSVSLILCLKPLAVNFGLVDLPCIRKKHDGAIPLVGGLAIYATLLVLSAFFPFWITHNGIWMIAIGLPLLLTGLADDRLDIPANVRLLVEVTCCLFATLYCDIRIANIGYLLPGVGGTLVMLSIPLTVVGMIGAINALNMTDGADGLAGGLAVLTLTALAYLAFPSNVHASKQILCIAASLCGFLVFNLRFFGRRRATVFLGDSGSTFIGFAIVWYLILLSQGTGAVITPVSALWLFAMPLLDTVTIMIRRIRHGQSPFAADREHLHHILLFAGFGVNRSVLIILSFHLVFILCGMASIHLMVPDWITFGTFMIIFSIYYFTMAHSWKMMKKIKHFREWAGFEDRRSEKRGCNGRRTKHDRRQARIAVLSENRLKAEDRRNGKDRSTTNTADSPIDNKM